MCEEYEGQVEAFPACGGSELSSAGTDQWERLASFGRVVLHPRKLRCEGCRIWFRPMQAFLECLVHYRSNLLVL